MQQVPGSHPFVTSLCRYSWTTPALRSLGQDTGVKRTSSAEAMLHLEVSLLSHLGAGGLQKVSVSSPVSLPQDAREGASHSTSKGSQGLG